MSLFTGNMFPPHSFRGRYPARQRARVLVDSSATRIGTDAMFRGITTTRRNER